MSFVPIPTSSVPDPKKYFNQKEYQKGYELIKLSYLIVIISIPIVVLLSIYIYNAIAVSIPFIIIISFILFIWGYRKRY